jgi:hypothetical protein
VVYLHPSRRTPWRHPERHIRLPFLRHLDEFDDVLLVGLYVEIIQLEVAVHGVARIPCK